MRSNSTLFPTLTNKAGEKTQHFSFPPQQLVYTFSFWTVLLKSAQIQKHWTPHEKRNALERSFPRPGNFSFSSCLKCRRGILTALEELSDGLEVEARARRQAISFKTSINYLISYAISAYV